MLESIRERTPVVSLYPRTQASVAIREIAASLEGLLNIDFETDGIAALFQQNDMS
jgi:MinD-like ATPase involved in chromosome partitioning or flagellar assembly